MFTTLEIQFLRKVIDRLFQIHTRTKVTTMYKPSATGAELDVGETGLEIHDCLLSVLSVMTG